MTSHEDAKRTATDAWTKFQAGAHLDGKQRNSIINLVRTLAGRVRDLEVEVQELKWPVVEEHWSSLEDTDIDRTPVRRNPLFQHCRGCNALITVDAKFCGFCGVQQ